MIDMQYSWRNVNNNTIGILIIKYLLVVTAKLKRSECSTTQKIVKLRCSDKIVFCSSIETIQTWVCHGNAAFKSKVK